MKVTNNQKEKIKEMKTNGSKETEIAEALKIKLSTVNYWANDNTRKRRIKSSRKYFLNLSKEEKKDYYRSRNEYNKAYNKRRYKEDSLFREKQKERARKYKTKNKINVAL